MGRLLEIARTLPALVPSPSVPRTTCEISVKSELSPAQAYRTQTHRGDKVAVPTFDPAASAVLGILVRAGQPVPHPAIVAALAGQGYDKAAARKAITGCQEKRWIEHDLLYGYVLTGVDATEKEFDEKESAMSRTAISVDNKAFPLPLLDLLRALNALGVEFCRRGDALALKGAGVLSGELRSAVADHKAALLALCDCRAELTRLHEYLIRLRCEDPPKGTRDKALSYQSAQIEKLAARSKEIGGTENGWPDPADVFADGDQVEGLRQGLAELSRADAPYPAALPEGCVLLPQANFDPFAHGRRYNGMLIRV